MRTTAAAALGLLLLTGCATRGPEDATPGRAASSATAPTSGPTSSPAPDPVQACVRQVTYWVGESLRAAPDQGFDYQHMGLSGATYGVVRSLTAEARAATGDVDALVARRSLEECRTLRGSGSTAGSDPGTGWP
ncbi:hypothetical protein ACK8HX_04635 [Oryzobacter sp. R7]|uniref:hypothetical protein n=1 Tax=Oryzobacter faecalis TaxID=3388656 RepID=UPI00398CAD0F